MQTPEYARVLFRAWRTDDDADKIEQLVAARTDRQKIFARAGAPSFWAVLDEGVLRRRVGSAKVMHDQLVHLADMGERASTKIHVIPAEAGEHAGLPGAFAIAGLAGDAPGIVYFESPDEGQTSRDPMTPRTVRGRCRGSLPPRGRSSLTGSDQPPASRSH